jgi:hypothetical protein
VLFVIILLEFADTFGGRCKLLFTITRLFTVTRLPVRGTVCNVLLMIRDWSPVIGEFGIMLFYIAFRDPFGRVATTESRFLNFTSSPSYNLNKSDDILDNLARVLR